MKSLQRISMVLCFWLTLHLPHAWAANSKISSDCSYKGKKLYGKIQVVEQFPDLKIKVVKNFPDLKVKVVTHFPDQCGQWQYVDHFPDLKIQFVENFEDLKVEMVENFPGIQ